MKGIEWNDNGLEALLAEFFSKDDLKSLAADIGAFLGCPLLILDEAFRVVAHHRPLGFSDSLFQDAVRFGKITYEVSALISKSQLLRTGMADYVKLGESIYQRRFAPLISADVRLGYLICIDVDGHLRNLPAIIWRRIEQILSKQMFIEASRRDKPFETAENILMQLLDGGFASASYFRLQTFNTYLADFHPSGFALIDLTAYHSLYRGKRHLKDELGERFPNAHSFLYRGDLFLFVYGNGYLNEFCALANEFKLKIIVSEGLEDLFMLPSLYNTAHEALELMAEAQFTGGNVCTVAQLRTPLFFKSIKNRGKLVAKELLALAAYDREKNSQYCETLYYYLTCSKSLKMAADALFTHRNTILYRIRRMQNDYGIPLDDPAAHTDLLLGVSLMLFDSKGPDSFLTNIKKHAD